MAAANAMRTYLRDIIGIADIPGDANARRVAVQEEGLNTIDDLIEFDDEGIQTLCQSVRKPGGTIVDPADATRRIPNPGYSIPAICEKRLKAAAYGARMYNMTGRTITHASLDRDRLRKFEQHRQLVKEHEDPEKLPEVSRSFGIMKAMDLVPTHLRDRLGVNKVPLSYVIRDDVIPPALQPQINGEVHGPPYVDLMEEMINHVELNGSTYNEDNAKVYQILQDMVTGTTFESSLKAFQRTRDGRSAYLALCQHNLGTAKWERVVEAAETYLLRREWNGRNQRFTLRAHVAKHRDAHNDLCRAAQFIQYDVPNERVRVSRFIKSIVTKDPNIVAALTHIQGTPAQRDDFETAVDFLLLTAPNHGNSNSNNHRISATRNGKSKGDKHGVGPETGVELRYHNKREYNKLSSEQKKELAEWRKNKRAREESNKENEDIQAQKISLLETTVATLEAQIAKLTSTKDKDSNPTKDPLTNPLTQRGTGRS